MHSTLFYLVSSNKLALLEGKICNNVYCKSVIVFIYLQGYSTDNEDWLKT